MKRQNNGVVVLALQLGSHMPERLIQCRLRSSISGEPVFHFAEILCRAAVRGHECDRANRNVGLEEALREDYRTYSVRMEMKGEFLECAARRCRVSLKVDAKGGFLAYGGVQFCCAVGVSQDSCVDDYIVNLKVWCLCELQDAVLQWTVLVCVYILLRNLGKKWKRQGEKIIAQERNNNNNARGTMSTTGITCARRDQQG